MLNLDLSKLSSFIPQDFVSSRQAGLEQAAAMLEAGEIFKEDYDKWR